MTYAIVPVSVSKYAAIVGSATFTMDPSIPSITTPSAIAASRSFWRRGSVIMEVTGISFLAGYFINVWNRGPDCGSLQPIGRSGRTPLLKRTCTVWQKPVQKTIKKKLNC